MRRQQTVRQISAAHDDNDCATGTFAIKKPKRKAPKKKTPKKATKGKGAKGKKGAKKK
jgi:hypothetical protein